MRLHTNNLIEQEIRDALVQEQSAGRIAGHVTFKTLDEHRSRSHFYAFEVQLEAARRDNGRRAGNSGSYGAMRPAYDGFAATFDEWGWLLAALYRIDPGMLVGSVKYPIYRNSWFFEELTYFTYNPEVLLPLLEDDSYDPYPYVTGRAAGFKRGYQVGRRGANRSDDPRAYRARKLPRTADEVRRFAYPLDTPAGGEVSP